MAELVFRSCMAHADWLLRGQQKTILPSRRCEPINKISELHDLNENKRRLGVFLWKSSNNNTSCILVLLFLKAVYLIYEANEWLMVYSKHEVKTKKLRGNVNGNIWIRIQHCKQRRKWTKSHIINVLLTSFARSVRESISLRPFSHIPRSFVSRAVRKPQANTFSYRPRTRLISLYIRIISLGWFVYWRNMGYGVSG